jgi:hypothetical protein
MAIVVTPKVQTVSRNQFNCQSMRGAPLENQVSEGICFGDHWDQRYFHQEMFSAGSPSDSASYNNFFVSPLTLALLEDSGWYKANFNTSKVSPWGHGVGCAFVNGSPCLIPANATNDDPPTVPDYSIGFFCNDQQQPGCSAGHSRKLSCSIVDYADILPSNLSPDEEFQYFIGEPNKGGPRQTDYCPIYSSTYDGSSPVQLDCTNPDNAPTSLNIYRYGSSKRAVLSVLVIKHN